jgi:glutathione S-transferase
VADRGAVTVTATPLLWQYAFSNFNEKVRWALDRKGIPHERRSLAPGSPRAMLLSRGNGTLPVLDLDGERIVDSTRIIGALERRWPDPSLYPADPGERERALALEDYFDEHAGHDIRRVPFWDMRDQRDYMVSFMTVEQGPAVRLGLRAGMPVAWMYAERRYRFYEDDVKRSRTQIVAALDRIVDELDGREHLVGEGFTVADLTAASLLYPLAWPPQLQHGLPRPPRWEFGEALADHPAVAWIRETYRRDRPPSAAVG